MNNADRIRAYARQNQQLGEFRPTPAQRRRIVKAARKGDGS